MYQGIRIAGFGGQGVISAGILLAQAEIRRNLLFAAVPAAHRLLLRKTIIYRIGLRGGRPRKKKMIAVVLMNRNRFVFRIINAKAVDGFPGHTDLPEIQKTILVQNSVANDQAVFRILFQPFSGGRGLSLRSFRGFCRSRNCGDRGG